MSIKVLFFGVLSEISGEAEIEISGFSDLDLLISEIKKRFPVVSEMKFTIARNREVIRENVKLKNGDEIALLPPFAGG